MATQARTWTFTADLEGLVDVGDSAIPVNWDSGPKMLEFGSISVGTTLAERARGPVTAGKDWTVLFPGIPGGATITDAQCTAWTYQRFAADKAWRIRMRIVDSAGASVHSAGELVDFSGATGNDASPVVNGAGTSRAVDAAKQAAATIVALELAFDFTGVLAGAEDIDFDDIAITITYTTTATVTPPLPTIVDFAVTRAANY